MTRTALPHRRPNETRIVQYEGRHYSVTVGFDPETGKPREVFADGPKYGSEMAHMLAVFCTVVSVALQHAIEPAELAKSLGRIPTWDGDRPDCVFGAILECLTE